MGKRGTLGAKTTPFYADGFQCENLPFATTFVSGNLEARTDTSAAGHMSYGWMGTTHRSSSFRTRFVLDAGRPIPLADFSVKPINELF